MAKVGLAKVGFGQRSASAKPTLANFSVLVFLPNFLVLLLFVVVCCCCVVLCCFVFLCCFVLLPKDPNPEPWRGRRSWLLWLLLVWISLDPLRPSSGTTPNFALFSLSHHNFLSFFPLLGSTRGVLVVFLKRRGSGMCEPAARTYHLCCHACKRTVMGGSGCNLHRLCPVRLSRMPSDVCLQ